MTIFAIKFSNMITASEKRRNNIAEYLLYMWQIEDVIRANNLDIDSIKRNVIDKYTSLSAQQRKDMEEWYESLIDMMRREGVETKGHLQINRNILMSLVDLHLALLKDPRFADYSAEFYRTLPYIVEIRAKSGEDKPGEIEACFNALYGMLIMRLQQKDVSSETLDAIRQISRFIAMLARNFHLDEQDKLFEPKE